MYNARQASTSNATSVQDPIASIEKGKWIVNLSQRKSDEYERRVLEQGLNFAPAPRSIPTRDIIASVEPAVRTRPDEPAAERERAAICNILRKAQPPAYNISKEEQLALVNLKSSEDIVIARANKGNAIVIMDKTAYEEKARQLLQQPPFRLLSKDPMKKTERELNGILRSMNSQLYERLRTSDYSPALFYGLPKVHKPDVPLRAIVSSIGTATYPTSKYLATLLQPLTRKFLRTSTPLISANFWKTCPYAKTKYW